MPVINQDPVPGEPVPGTAPEGPCEWPLNTNQDAFVKAQAWSEQMAREGRLYHSNLTQGAPWGWRSIAENVGCGPDLPAIQRALEASPGHRANLLNPAFDRVAVGVVHRNGVFWITEVFIG